MVDEKPLNGKRIVITRPKEQSNLFIEKLENAGAIPIVLPTINIVSTEDFSSLDQNIEDISNFNWIIFTSSNSVRFFTERFFSLGKTIDDLKETKIASIGSSTSSFLNKKGFKVDFQPSDYVSEGFVKEFLSRDVSGLKILIPRALEAREVIPERLRQAGADVIIVAVYKTVLSELNADNITRLIKDKDVDLITFTSGSTFSGFHKIIKGQKLDLRQIRIASIGPVTSQKIIEQGFKVDIEAKKHTIGGLVKAIIEYYQ